MSAIQDVAQKTFKQLQKTKDWGKVAAKVVLGFGIDQTTLDEDLGQTLRDPGMARFLPTLARFGIHVSVKDSRNAKELGKAVRETVASRTKEIKKKLEKQPITSLTAEEQQEAMVIVVMNKVYNNKLIGTSRWLWLDITMSAISASGGITFFHLEQNIDTYTRLGFMESYDLTGCLAAIFNRHCPRGLCIHIKSLLLQGVFTTAERGWVDDTDLRKTMICRGIEYIKRPEDVSAGAFMGDMLGLEIAASETLQRPSAGLQARLVSLLRCVTDSANTMTTELFTSLYRVLNAVINDLETKGMIESIDPEQLAVIFCQLDKKLDTGGRLADLAWVVKTDPDTLARLNKYQSKSLTDERAKLAAKMGRAQMGPRKRMIAACRNYADYEREQLEKGFDPRQAMERGDAIQLEIDGKAKELKSKLEKTWEDYNFGTGSDWADEGDEDIEFKASTSGPEVNYTRVDPRKYLRY